MKARTKQSQNYTLFSTPSFSAVSRLVFLSIIFAVFVSIVAVCYNVLQCAECVTERCSVLQHAAACCGVLQCVASCCKCVAACCFVLQHAAMCFSVS